MKVKFLTKARTLENLSGKIKSAKILPLYIITFRSWKFDENSCLKNIKKSLGNGPFIVRSSSKNEDGFKNSNAGAFLSLNNTSYENVSEAINKVFASYHNINLEDEIFIQPMLQNVKRSGVVFSHDPNNSSPYRIINWSEGSDTSIVTGGLGGRIWQQAANSPIVKNTTFSQIIELLEELLNLFDEIPIDCEFAITKTNKQEVLWLLQVRPLILKELPESNNDQYIRLKNIHSKITRGMQSHPFLIGEKTVYGVMPDWNPAEIIGVRPRPLALSLYRDLITDSIWAYQRHNYGYRNLRSFPLMPNFYGLPYIDVRLSFNSFIPADLDEKLAGKLVDHYINRLLKEPTLHDKVEFEIVLSCYTLDFPKHMSNLKKFGFKKSECDEIEESLRKLTSRIVHPTKGLWKTDAKKLDILNVRREELYGTSSDPIEKIYWLLEDAKRYGTLPFAGLARAGFIAIQMLKSMVNVGILSTDEYDIFLESVSTVSGKLTVDRLTQDKETFLSNYGHLRPGTYDILSLRYDEDPDLYFDWEQKHSIPKSTNPFTLTISQMKEIGKLLDLHGIDTNPVELFEFMQSGIELRESAKFQFSKNLSDAIVLINEIGEKNGFSRDDLSYCDITTFKDLYVGAKDPKDLIRRSIQQGKALYKETLKTTLPPLITNPDDVWSFEWPEMSPNFITKKQITSSVVSSDEKNLLKDSIVCIPNADPGYDWLFSYSISGLITAWGGANSHMAIRAGELGLPAVIGAGEILFKRWSSAKTLFIDCPGKKVEILE